MNESRNSDHAPQLEPALASAVQAILAEDVPERVAERLKDWARRLPTSREPAKVTHHNGRAGGKARWRLVAWSASAAAVVVALVSFSLLSSNSRLAMAEMLEAVGKQPWIHGTTTYADGPRTATSEFWVSPVQRVTAGKFGDRVQFDNLETGISLKYNAKDGTLYRVTTASGVDATFTEGQLPELLERLVAGEAVSSGLFRGERVIEAEQHREEHEGKRWLEYAVRLERIDNPKIRRTVRIRLDPQTQLPELWEERRAGGLTVVTKFDYPSTGPKNIYELGVPKTAKLIDRVPRDVLAEIIAKQQAAREGFDAYDAIVVEHSEGVRTGYEDLRNLTVTRVRRNGTRYRVDRLLSAKEGLVAPEEDADMSKWWRENREQYWSVPTLICDGTTIHFYSMVDDRIVPGEKPNLAVVPRAAQAVGVPPGDATVPWPHLMPEQCSHPHLWSTVETRQFDVSEKPDDGPAGSVRVIITRTAPRRGGELFRYWFDPTRDYVLQKEVGTVFDPMTDQVAYTGTEQYDDFAQSPSGQWFPQRVRRETSDNPNWSGVRRFYLDFDVRLERELFEPLPKQ